MKVTVVLYFSHLFASNGVQNFDEVLCNISPSVMEETNSSLESAISDDENVQYFKCIQRKLLTLMVCLLDFIKNIGGWLV